MQQVLKMNTSKKLKMVTADSVFQTIQVSMQLLGQM